MKPTIIIDANVWFTKTLGRLLLELFRQNLFFVYWTEQIQEEWMRNKLKNTEKEKRKPKSKQELEEIKAKINKEFPASVVEGYEHLIPQMTNHKDDRHVLAAAVATNCNVILTYNIKDFKPEDIQQPQIKAFTPDDFLKKYAEKNNEQLIKALRIERVRLKDPKKTPSEYLDMLEKCIPETVKECKKFAHRI